MAKVIVYSTTSCPWCAKAKEFLRENNVEFEDINVSEDIEKQTEMIMKSGQMGVPVIDIDGEIIVGFDVDRIRKLLKL